MRWNIDTGWDIITYLHYKTTPLMYEGNKEDK